MIETGTFQAGSDGAIAITKAITGSSAEMRKGRSFFKIPLSRSFQLTSNETYNFLTKMSTTYIISQSTLSFLRKDL
jgi:hypothetical protein